MESSMELGGMSAFFKMRSYPQLLYYLVHEMLFIRALKPYLNVQSDSIRAKLFL